MRRLLSAALLVFPTFCLAANADRICVERARTLHSVEWTERGELWGARVVITDPQWQLGAVEWKSGGQGFRGNAIFCEACLDGHIAVADVWLGASNPIDPEEVLSTESLTGWVRGYLFHDVFPSSWGLSVKSDSVAVKTSGTEGLARAIVVQFPSGARSEMIAVAAAKGCLGLYAILHEIPLDRIGSLLSAIGIKRYGPTPAPELPGPPGPIDLLAPGLPSLLEQLRGGRSGAGEAR